jgi:hypothetical protein
MISNSLMGRVMKRVGYFVAALAVAFAATMPLFGASNVTAAPIAGETFRGLATQPNQWISGGGTEDACLTAATVVVPNSIPPCDEETAIDTDGNGALRLTSASNNQSGFAFYNTAIPSDEGLKVSFDMYQYGTTSGSGADGISFFLIDGTASPTEPGALGGSLGYSSAVGTPNKPGLVGGYVGVGFDRYGNFSHPDFGTGGPGRVQNSITVRGSEDSGYQFVSRKSASGSIANDGTGIRANAKRSVIVSVSTNNIMTVQVDYNNGQGYVTELSGLDLNAINGQGSLPETFKFGFAASTGGSNNIHEISGLSIDPLDPKLKLRTVVNGAFKQDEPGQYTVYVENDEGAEATVGDITVVSTLPDGMRPLSASGDGWTCGVAGQVVTCTRPGADAQALQPGDETPGIVVKLMIDETIEEDQNIVTTATTEGGSAESEGELDDEITVTPSTDDDTVADSIETDAPNTGDANNDGELDADQPKVTSLPNPVTNTYAVLESTGTDCTGNKDVSVSAVPGKDGTYTYPAGMIDFKLTCVVGGTANVSMYYYGLANTANLVLRKYNPTTKTYTTIPGAVFSSVTIAGQTVTKITYALTDGGVLDTDGTANGVIIDPAGPAVLAATISAPNTGAGTGNALTEAYGAITLGLGLLAAYRLRRFAPAFLRK